MNKYNQITTGERYIISHMRRQGQNHAEIARVLGRARSTICREVKRNLTVLGHYKASKAQERANGRRTRTRKGPKISKNDFKIVIKLLKKKWSPEQISNHLKMKRLLSISHETIYRYIWRDKSNGGTLYKHLRQSPKKKRKRYRAYDSRGVLAGKRPIEDRPLSAQNRSRIGHFEIDTVLGKGSKHCIMTLVDRKTGYLFIQKLRSRTTAELNASMLRVHKREPHRIKTITADNGTEFHQYKLVERKMRVPFYFAKPYHSWERGTNENTNGLIRQYLPKGKSMARVTQARCDAIATALNTRPRKRYGFRSPAEIYESSICFPRSWK